MVTPIEDGRGAITPPVSKQVVPRAGEGKRGEDGYFGYLLRQAAGAYRYRMEATLADLGITQPQFAVMAMLSAYPGLSNADLARAALLTPQTLSVIVANLEKAGTIVKRRHASNERIRQLELSEKGEALYAVARGRVRLLEADLASGYSEAEQKIIRHWLAAVTAGTPEG
ncbi:MarR family winged helix-turn-helix transcriptional regulator [Mesorhizobium retamae]|uniref:MarR family transcriptional regulator n=1 Tax=Mesorhizobium retamae TaxID=2912854 RepID=A0ABS9Q9Z1_9HYPH|nr:MarR family transcriptional regulator [Mesorhizobium sp. IRAMC:0171]MCG7504213.1 MarR family transcriptional regulator [Mesorhizobium sp. IRAMC:0171]